MVPSTNVDKNRFFLNILVQWPREVILCASQQTINYLTGLLIKKRIVGNVFFKHKPTQFTLILRYLQYRISNSYLTYVRWISIHNRHDPNTYVFTELPLHCPCLIIIFYLVLPDYFENYCAFFSFDSNTIQIHTYSQKPQAQTEHFYCSKR